MKSLVRTLLGVLAAIIILAPSENREVATFYAMDVGCLMAMQFNELEYYYKLGKAHERHSPPPPKVLVPAACQGHCIPVPGHPHECYR